MLLLNLYYIVKKINDMTLHELFTNLINNQDRITEINRTLNDRTEELKNKDKINHNQSISIDTAQEIINRRNELSDLKDEKDDIISRNNHIRDQLAVEIRKLGHIRDVRITVNGSIYIVNNEIKNIFNGLTTSSELSPKYEIIK